MYKFIINLSIFLVFPFISGSTYEKLTVEDIEKIKNNREYYEVIEATTGKKEKSQFYAEDEVVKTHIESVSSLKKALAGEGIDTSKVRIELYYDPIAIRDDLPRRIWNSKSHPDTVSSPWLDLTKTVTTSGETRITIRIDATTARMIADLFSKSGEINNHSSLLSIPSIKQSCFLAISDTYKTEKLNSGTLRFKKVPDTFKCVPKELRKPLLFLFESSLPGSLGSLDIPVMDRLNYYCQSTAREYYRELYYLLSLKALDIFENELELHPKWWAEIIKPVKQNKKCQT